MSKSFLDTIHPSSTNSAVHSGAETTLCKQLRALGLITASYSTGSFSRLAHYLTRVAEDALAVRDHSRLMEAAEFLINIPIPAARHIGAYFYGFALKRQGERGSARRFFEEVASQPTTNYRARAIQTLGGMQWEDGDLEEASRLATESIRASSEQDLVTLFFAHNLRP